MNQPVSNQPRTCEELGLCQMQPFCQHECVRKFPFAPGVIEGPAAPRSRLGSALWFVAVAVGVVSAIVVVGFGSGYLQHILALSNYL